MMKKRNKAKKTPANKSLSETEIKRLISLTFSDDPTERREGFNFLFGNPPERIQSIDQYAAEDVVEFHVLVGPTCWNGFPVVTIGGHECESETIYELEFLTYLSRAIERGSSFTESWTRAVRLMWALDRVPCVVYELTHEDQSEIEVWLKRIVNNGVQLTEATGLARGITALLRQIWLTQKDDWYSEDIKLEMSDRDWEDRRILLEKLASIRGVQAVA
jgi:hypothetical protein